MTAGDLDFEDAILLFAEQTSEDVFERFTSGELSREELERVYSSLRQWTQETENLLRMRAKPPVGCISKRS